MTQSSSSDRRSPGQRARHELAQRLRTIDELDAFLIDCFPKVKARFSPGMDRVARENLLLEMHQPDEVLAAIHDYRIPLAQIRRSVFSRAGLVVAVMLMGAAGLSATGLSIFHSGQREPQPVAFPPVALLLSEENLHGAHYEEALDFGVTASRLRGKVRVEGKFSINSDGKTKSVTAVLIDVKSARPIAYTTYISPIPQSWCSRVSPATWTFLQNLDRQIQEKQETQRAERPSPRPLAASSPARWGGTVIPAASTPFPAGVHDSTPEPRGSVNRERKRVGDKLGSTTVPTAPRSSESSESKPTKELTQPAPTKVEPRPRSDPRRTTPKDDLDSLLDSASAGTGGKPSKPRRDPNLPEHLPEQLSMDVIKSTLKGVGFASCAAQGASGIYTVQLIIEQTGVVSDAWLANGGAGGDCVIAAVKGTRFPEFTGDAMSLTYPFIVR